MNDMNKTGDRIAKIRKFRGMTQAELGIALGFNPTNASVRVSQYESNKKVPKEDIILKIAEALNIHPIHLLDDTPSEYYPIVFIFWLEEMTQFKMNLYPYLFNSCEPENEDEEAEEIPDEFDPEEFYGVKNINRNRGNSVIGIYRSRIPGSYHDQYVLEFIEKKKEFYQEKLSNDEYFDWKIRWPYSSQYGDHIYNLNK